MDNNLVDDLKNEFSIEVENHKISAQDLKKFGVSDIVLKSEIYLKKYYGEDILLNEEAETVVDVSQTKIEKVDLNEINKISELTKMIDDVSNTDFDRFVEYLSSKASKE
ncbi:MAG: hypothetical protein IJX17_08285 [Clostridia bacterium]|nr:hypothetical protein [Clostridia bacterium]